MLKKRGKFIVVEGIDGAGKGTQAKILAQRLRDMGESVYEACAPRNIGVGADIRKILRGEVPHPGAFELQKLMAEDRLEQAREIEEKLEAGVTVVCDRYFYSGLAYGCADGVSWKDLWALNKDFARADLMIWIDVTVGEAIDRIKGKRELFERKDSLETAAKIYAWMAKNKKRFPEVVRLDGQGTVEHVATEAWQLVSSKLFPEV